MSTTPVIAPEAGAPPWEFTPEQNVILLHLVSRMKVVGVALMILAALLGTWSVLGSGGMLAFQAGLVLGLTGWWSWRASWALSRAATTQGADSRYLMRALGEIGKLYELQYWVFLAAALLLGVTVLVAITGAGWLPRAW